MLITVATGTRKNLTQEWGRTRRRRRWLSHRTGRRTSSDRGDLSQLVHVTYAELKTNHARAFQARGKKSFKFYT